MSSNNTKGMTTLASKEYRRLKELFKDYGLRPATIALISKMGFTVSTLIHMKDDEVDFVIKSIMEDYHLELLIGEQFGIKSAVRAKRRLLDQELEWQRLHANSRRRCTVDSFASVSALALPSIEGHSLVREPSRVQKRIHMPPELLTQRLPLLSDEAPMLGQGDTPLSMTGLVALADVSSDGDIDSGWENFHPQNQKLKRKWISSGPEEIVDDKLKDMHLVPGLLEGFMINGHSTGFCEFTG
ncbi:unnamed protein product [Sphagnum jensenii]|uniref:Floricaula/leafy-like transcription factor n=1 Tax=Sphagnum jensenii TaxID=128206 RepID=A0ABP1B8N7_9BRYO